LADKNKNGKLNFKEKGFLGEALSKKREPNKKTLLMKTCLLADLKPPISYLLYLRTFLNP
jgi:hypothetical protein